MLAWAAPGFAMRIVLLNQFYPPDLAPTGRYLHDVARALVAAGHVVTVIASQHAYGGGGSYPQHECLDGVWVRRLPGTAFGRAGIAGKLADYAGYSLQLAAHLARQERPELIVALTTPPYLGLLARWTARVRGVRHAHWIMDIYPDVMQAQGMLQGPGYHALQALSRHAFADASAVVTLAPGMAERMRRYTTSATPVSWVPLWVPEGLEPWSSERPPALRAERGWEPERLVLLYSGNLGLGHRFDELLDVARTLGPSGPRWAFAGAGRARPQVEQFVRAHPELPVELLPNVPDARLREHLCSADVHVVSLAPSWEDTLLPSKLQAALAVHKPVLYLGDPRGDLGRWITDYGIGWVVPPGDTGALLAALARASDRVERADCVAAAGEAARSRFGRAPNIARMIELLTAS